MEFMKRITSLDILLTSLITIFIPLATVQRSVDLDSCNFMICSVSLWQIKCFDYEMINSSLIAHVRMFFLMV